METITNPNFSIILPGGCNCNCDFCFWRKDKNQDIDGDAFLDALENALYNLPEQFEQISITGGEPTISPLLHETLEIIATRREDIPSEWTKVVFTTNGSNLKKCLEDIPHLFDKAVDFVNISRHSEFPTLNNIRFGLDRLSKLLPSGMELTALIKTLNKMGKRVTANYVLKEGVTHQPIDFIREAKRCGFSEICFRKQHREGGTLEPTVYENIFADYTVVNHSECPVCRSDTRIINGMTTVWTASIPEPSQELDLIYEAVLHADGTLSADWSKEIELEL